MVLISQADVLDFLKKQREPIPCMVIVNAIVNQGICSRVTVLSSLRRLKKHGEIQYITIDRIEARKRFGKKRRIKLYFIERVNTKGSLE